MDALVTGLTIFVLAVFVGFEIINRIPRTHNITVKINHQGAELCSLQTNNNKQEYIWEGNPDFWGKHSPVLFPIVGTL